MEIKSYLGMDLVNRLLDVGGSEELGAFVGEVALRVIERGYGVDVDGTALNLVCPDLQSNLRRVFCDRELSIVTDAFPGYVIFYCEHPALVGQPLGLEGLREVSKKGDPFITDLLKRMELWRWYHRIDEYLSMNMNGITDDTAGFVIVGKSELTKDVL